MTVWNGKLTRCIQVTATNVEEINCEYFFLLQVLVDYAPYVPDRPRGRPPGSRKNKHPRKPLVVTRKNKVYKYKDTTLLRPLVV